MRRHVIESAYYVGGARLPPSTVVRSVRLTTVIRVRMMIEGFENQG